MNRQLVIFIHGFNGGFLSTWGDFPTLLRDHADSDSSLTDWDYLFIGYRTLGPGGISSFAHIAGLIRTHVDDALQGNMPERPGEPYSRVGLIGHSLGTLGIRALVASAKNCPNATFNTIDRIGLFGPPLNGSVFAHFARWIAPIGPALIPRNRQLSSLKRTVTNGWRRRPWNPAKVRLGLHDMVVGAPFINWPGDAAPPDMVAAGHYKICKPEHMRDQPVRFLRSVLR